MKKLVLLFVVISFPVFSNTFSPNVQGFEENRGQLGDTEGKRVEEVIFYTKHKDFGVYITEKGVSYVIYRYEEQPQAAGSNEIMLPDKYQTPRPMNVHYSRIDIDLLNSTIDRSNIEYKDELPGYSNYYLGHCPEGVLYVKSYKELRIKNVYKGIDWIWRYDNRGELHHEFELSTDVEPEAIKLKINYSDYEITPDGKKLILSTPIGKIEDGFVIGHRSGSMIFPVEVKYRDNGDGTIGYSVSNWDRSSKLIIDPPLSLTWASFYGGDQIDFGSSISSDNSGNVFVAGYTQGGTFPLHNPGGGAYYQGTYGGGNWDAFISKFADAVVSVEPISNNIPDSYRLYQNYPNPFNPVTRIRFDLPKESHVRIVIYDINGHQISVPVNQNLKAASYEFTFDGSSLSSGIYFYRFEAGEFTETRKMIVVS